MNQKIPERVGSLISLNNLNELKNKSGVYCIVNPINDKKYFGSSEDLYTRFKCHLTNLLTNKNTFYLQQDFNLHKTNFIFFVIDFVDVEQIINLEQEYLDQYHDKQKNCYNVASQALRNAGWEHSEETKKNQSNRMFKLMKNEAYVAQKKEMEEARKVRFFILNPLGEEVFVDGISHFARKNNLKISMLSKLYNNDVKYYKGWKMPQNKDYIPTTGSSQRKKYYNLILFNIVSKETVIVEGYIEDINKIIKGDLSCLYGFLSGKRKVRNRKTVIYKSWKIISKQEKYQLL